MTGVPASLQLLREHGFISAGHAHFGRLCGTGDDEATRPVIEVVAAVASLYLTQGHSCAPVSALADQAVRNDDGQVVASLPSAPTIHAALETSTAVTQAPPSGELSTPLVLDEEGRIYVARFFEHERRLAQSLARLVSARREAPPTDWLEHCLDRYFPQPSVTEEGDGSVAPDMQRLAAARAVSFPFSIISGGPGTGKTSTVVKILALLFDAAARSNDASPEVLLLAPTGKAAARMLEATVSAFADVDGQKELAGRIRNASTIHRALGVMADNPTRFRRGPKQPLRADVVIVDEASMVDLALMRHLVEALSPTARLILLGDRHQLASVEAGSVLGELCAAQGTTSAVREAQSESSAPAAMVELKKSYRFGHDSGIFALAQAVREGDVEAALEVLHQQRSDLTFAPFTPSDFAASEFGQLIVARYGAALRQTGPAAALDVMSRFRVLCAHRRGPYGVETLNDGIVRLLRAGGLVSASRGGAVQDEFYRGRLVLVVENDYEMALFNGDVGIIWPDDGGRMAAYFPGEGGQLRALAPAQLPRHETAYALTIHKSQGSEHDEVALVLPPDTSPLLSRELIYTGITRAKKSVVVLGDEAALRVATSRSVVRHSGLSARLSRAVARRGQSPP